MNKNVWVEKASEEKREWKRMGKERKKDKCNVLKIWYGKKRRKEKRRGTEDSKENRKIKVKWIKIWNRRKGRREK